MSKHHRIRAFQRLLTEESVPLHARIAGLLILLCTQPTTRIVRISDIIVNDGTTTICFGDPPTPVPVPVAWLLQGYLTNRINLDAATNPGSH